MAHRKKIGRIVRQKTAKTAAVEVAISKKHPLYNKRFTIARIFAVHVEDSDCKIGDMVEIEECRPISKRKRWRVVRKTKN